MAPKSGSQALSGGELGNGYALSRVARSGEGVTLAISGEIDIANAEAFTDDARSLIDSGDGQVALDLENCVFIDSTGIRALIVLAQEQQARGGNLKLSRVTGEPRRVLGVAGFLESGLFCEESEQGEAADGRAPIQDHV